MIAITDTKLVIVDKRSTGSECFPLLFDRNRRLVLGPMLEILCRQVLEIVSSPAQFTLMTTPVVQIEQMIGILMIKADDITHPCIMAGGCPELHLRSISPGHSFLTRRSHCRINQLCLRDKIRIDFPLIHLFGHRIAQREVIVK